MSKIAIIGLGKMGGAISSSLKENNFQILKLDTRENFSPNDLSKSNFIFLCTKPNDATQALLKIKNSLNKNSILISIVAGLKISQIQKISNHKKIVRAMPNLAAIVSSSTTCYSPSENISKKEKEKIIQILNSFGKSLEIKEELIDAATAASGSGIAYFLYLANQMQIESQKMGFDKESSNFLILNTLLGAAQISNKYNSDFSDLISKISTKGGTTQAALEVFEKNKFPKIISKAMSASKKRSKSILKKS